MNPGLVTESVQVNSGAEELQRRTQTSGQIYSTRKDILGIKARLLELVSNREYWPTLSKFVNGECSKVKYDEVMSVCLQTNEMRILHNELIRSIIFNAHFSTIPPPGIFPPKETTQETKKPLSPSSNRTFLTYAAGDMGHLHTHHQLSERVALLLQQRHIRMESNALMILLIESRRYVSTILGRSVELASAGRVSHCTRITADNVEFVSKNCVLPHFVTYK